MVAPRVWKKIHSPRKMECLVSCHRILVARFGKKAVIGRCALLGEHHRGLVSSLWREGSSRGSGVSGSKITVFWWLA